MGGGSSRGGDLGGTQTGPTRVGSAPKAVSPPTAMVSASSYLFMKSAVVTAAAAAAAAAQSAQKRKKPSPPPPATPGEGRGGAGGRWPGAGPGRGARELTELEHRAGGHRGAALHPPS